MVIKKIFLNFRNAIARCDRSGMSILGAHSASSALGDSVALAHEYLQSTDSHPVGMTGMLSVFESSLAMVSNSFRRGTKNSALCCVTVGDDTDAAVAAVIATASIMLSNLVLNAHYHILHVVQLDNVVSTSKPCLWVNSVVRYYDVMLYNCNTPSQAFSRSNFPLIIFGDIFTKCGSGVPEMLFEIAAAAVVLTASGSHLAGVAGCEGRKPHAGGLEARLMAKVGAAVISQRLTIEQANFLALQIMQRYEHVLDGSGSVPEGNPFCLAYSKEDGKPLEHMETLYSQIKATLSSMGLDISD